MEITVYVFCRISQHNTCPEPCNIADDFCSSLCCRSSDYIRTIRHRWTIHKSPDPVGGICRSFGRPIRKLTKTVISTWSGTAEVSIPNRRHCIGERAIWSCWNHTFSIGGQRGLLQRIFQNHFACCSVYKDMPLVLAKISVGRRGRIGDEDIDNIRFRKLILNASDIRRKRYEQF